MECHGRAEILAKARAQPAGELRALAERSGLSNDLRVPEKGEDAGYAWLRVDQGTEQAGRIASTAGEDVVRGLQHCDRPVERNGQQVAEGSIRLRQGLLELGRAGAVLISQNLGDLRERRQVLLSAEADRSARVRAIGAGEAAKDRYIEESLALRGLRGEPGHRRHRAIAVGAHVEGGRHEVRRKDQALRRDIARDPP